MKKLIRIVDDSEFIRMTESASLFSDLSGNLKDTIELSEPFVYIVGLNIFRVICTINQLKARKVKINDQDVVEMDGSIAAKIKLWEIL